MKNRTCQKTEQERYDASTRENKRQNLITQRNLENLMNGMDGKFSVIAYMTESLFGEPMPMLHFFKNSLSYVMREPNWIMAVNIREKMPFFEILRSLWKTRNSEHILDAKQLTNAFTRPGTYRRSQNGTDEFYLASHLHGELPLTLYVRRGKPLDMDRKECMAVVRGIHGCKGLPSIVVTDYISREDVIHLFKEKYPDKFE